MVVELRKCFDNAVRLNQYQIADRLKDTFGELSPNCLKASQVQGWVCAEAGRRKKKPLQEIGKEAALDEDVEDEGRVPVESDKESSAEGDSSDENDDEEAYEVRAVTDTRRDADGEEEFKVLWENYPDGDYSWEPRENFLGCSAKKILAAFEQRNEKRKRPGQVASGSKRFKLLCGMKVVLDPDRDDDEPNWLRGGLDKKYKEKNVCVEHDGTKYNGTVDQYAFSVAAGETNVPAVFQIQYEGTAPGDIQVLNRMDVERAMTLHSREQRGKRSRRN